MAQTKQRETKILLAALATAATLSGWAWLTAAQSTAATDPRAASSPTRANALDLANLPVRGLREVGGAGSNSQSSAQMQSAPIRKARASK